MRTLFLLASIACSMRRRQLNDFSVSIKEHIKPLEGKVLEETLQPLPLYFTDSLQKGYNLIHLFNKDGKNQMPISPYFSTD
jgi:hypothetical protein